ncbi:MAG TPA: bifunctional diaminohydroxyphosphoribosylaminopyrimidine deaminase/5-amino-6-(5-phosphoribosylamino)uracil reductase RibD, partial [Hanamia sp.]|nr:bifunctional diaminohydroxyphosphoribosylaminopyrimidine deaminase/5-amino-6-(5-phosphoribosylamino)uracil reductase RibD [Hanamia sp.]
EVNCVNSVKEEDKPFIEKSKLYVSLEPCAHFGKTPPCTNLIISQKIKKVVIGCTDIYKEVSGKGIQKLKDAGVEVIVGVLEKECIDLNKRFFTFHQKRRPYIILKWAQSANGKMGSLEGERILISNDYTNRLVHKWRSEESSILVGTNTALKDNPLLTTRWWPGKNPTRIVIDKELKLPDDLNLFNDEADIIIFNLYKNEERNNRLFIKIEENNFLQSFIDSLFAMNIQSVLVEGGAKTLQSFIDAGLWDEARIITNEELVIDNGVASPELKDFFSEKQETYFSNLVSYYKK